MSKRATKKHEFAGLLTIGKDPAGHLAFSVDWFSAAAHRAFERAARSKGMTPDDLMRTLAQVNWSMEGDGEYQIDLEDLAPPGDGKEARA